MSERQENKYDGLRKEVCVESDWEGEPCDYKHHAQRQSSGVKWFPVLLTLSHEQMGSFIKNF